MVKEKIVEQVWKLTRPADDFWAGEYWVALKKVVPLPPRKRYRKAFPRRKPRGGHRLIRPARKQLGRVQYFLAKWLKENFPRSSDFCYNGLRVKPAAEVHLTSKHALVVDLFEAFNFVTAKKLKCWLKFWLKVHSQDVPEEVLDLIIDLLTFEGRAPQGCVSTPYCFNLVMEPLDHQLLLVAKKRGLKFTRYSDNLCFSAARWFDFDELKELVSKKIHDYGFKVGWTERYEGAIQYLGVCIHDGKLDVVEGKLEEFREELRAMRDSPAPGAHYHEACGIWSWLRQIYGKKIPKDLLKLLGEYFAKVGTLKPLAGILAEKLQYELWPEED